MLLACSFGVSVRMSVTVAIIGCRFAYCDVLIGGVSTGPNELDGGGRSVFEALVQLVPCVSVGETVVSVGGILINWHKTVKFTLYDELSFANGVEAVGLDAECVRKFQRDSGSEQFKTS